MPTKPTPHRIALHAAMPSASPRPPARAAAVGPVERARRLLMAFGPRSRMVLVPRAALSRYSDAYDDLASLAGTVPCACDPKATGMENVDDGSEAHRCASAEDEQAIDDALAN